MATRRNSEIVPSWEGQLIPEVWADVQRGLMNERDRLRGSRFVTLVLRRSFDYDGLTEWVYLGRGYADAGAARVHVEEEVDKCVGLYVRTRALNAEAPWRKLDQPKSDRWPDSAGWAGHLPVHRVKWGDGIGFNSEEYYGVVFAVDPADPLSDTLLAAIGQEPELVSYFQGAAQGR